jgi:cytochrome c biogenesis protein CcmG/thiol:disulfide interchange protein DsbE
VEPDRAHERRRARSRIPALILVPVLALAGCMSSSDGPGASPVSVGGHPLYGQPAPEIDLQTFDGERVTLSSLRGRPVLVNFWASWCIPCRTEFPLMVETYAERADEGLEIMGILHDDTVEGGRAFAADQGATWPMLYDADDEAWDDYLGLGMPTSFFIDADGIVRAFSLGPFSEEGLPRQLATIMPSAAASPTVEPR